MAKMTYLAELEPTDGDGYGVTFPDLPGCVSFGDDPADALRGAEEALSLHLEGMAEEGIAFPEPGHVGDAVLARRQSGDPTNYVYSLITVEAPDQAERVNVYLAKSLLERVDRFARTAGINRSGFFSQAARHYMREQDQRRITGSSASDGEPGPPILQE